MKYVIEDTTLKDIADSIRFKTGSTEGIDPIDMPSVIRGIGGNGDYEIIEGIEIPLNLADGDQFISVPDGYAVKSAIIKKPETLVPENIVKDIEIAGVVGTSVGGGGGGSVEGFATVTFMNGNEPIYSRPIYIGDDCPDPVTQGRVEAPTKESTVDKDFAYNGWTLAEGEAANSSALKNITEDKILYAAYTSSARKYTITYYDEDGTTVLHTEQVAYGTVPSYVPEKEGVLFDKWTPTLTVVTDDASYTASWKNAIASGICGDNLYWTVDPDYNLIISGTGDMYDYELATPWSDYKPEIKNIVFENGITHIGVSAFMGFPKLTKIVFPDGLTSIGDNAFWYSSNIESIILPDSIVEIGKGMFVNSKLTDVYYGGSEEDRANISIAGGNDKLINATWHYKKGTMGDCAWALNGTVLTISGNGDMLPDTSGGINVYPWHDYQNEITTVIIKNGVTNIGIDAFRFCTSLSSVIIPNSVTKISSRAFDNCSSLTSITIPNNVTIINYATFNNCESLTSVTIPNSVTKIDDLAFRLCANLTDVYYSGTEIDKAGITIIGSENFHLTEATWHYNHEFE